MGRHLMRRCTACDAYTLQASCPHCGGKVEHPQPARYSPEDPYGDYRRRLKRMDQAEKADAARTTGGGPAPPADALPEEAR